MVVDATEHGALHMELIYVQVVLRIEHVLDVLTLDQLRDHVRILLRDETTLYTQTFIRYTLTATITDASLPYSPLRLISLNTNLTVLFTLDRLLVLTLLLLEKILEVLLVLEEINYTGVFPNYTI
jgi:hypothetical protein